MLTIVTDDQIAVAVIAGLSALAVAVVGLVGALASRNEPRAAKELAALNTILERLPPGEARDALEDRRTRIAVAYGARREPLGVFTVAYLFFFGGYLLSLVSLLVVGGDAGAWQSLVTSLFVGLVFTGLVFVLIGFALFVAGIVFKVRDWRHGHNLQISADGALAPTAVDLPDAAHGLPRQGIPERPTRAAQAS
ncbi:hypothetical protein [Microbacterium sp. zg-B96]|uniref:hypothetical protein n=1 Tax=Microbacterium sp. zg-B96 TaxID=3049069 RepID=UPI00254F293D|nr:hypothetical protein [Microbacterium sp. zg-B96]WIM14998.1 hypothetical protein QNO11_10595 [Microbacterium sp. zg-B96]